ncbi:SipW-dependent-type signal peptide-containing protein [Microbacterium thalli]|uniref:SipW-dependent-type signal peptide-containing protein n=1 Tax=Microbacterium thalli TaxID=3027921 RepID=UPI0023671869|nr:SipW-dependent-type signal peptide-containing protein [Microbacterium thalli]MDD7928345.1 SipW-dependent-type signal peptide-containing protein [Microbacterium thalli]
MRRTIRVAEPVKLVLAGGLALGLLVGATSAAFSDQADVSFAPIGATYDLGFVAADGSVAQGNPEPWPIDTGEIGPIPRIGEGDPARVEVKVKNAGTVDAGDVTFSLASLLPPVPDGDGVVRDALDVTLASIWVDGVEVATRVPAAEAVATIPDWPAGGIRTVVVELVYLDQIPSPYYYGRDVLLGLTATGAA